MANLATGSGPHTRRPLSLPSSYLLVSKAGEGVDAAAYFCLPEKAARQALSKGAALEDLRRQLQVVKVAKDTTDRPPRTEIAILDQIKEQCMAHTKEVPLVEILDASPADARLSWIAMSTIPISCDLAALDSRYKEMPE